MTERLVRVPPRLTAPQRRRGEQTLRELKLLVDHRDDLVDERRRSQQRLRWHLHELDLGLHVPLGALDRAVWLDRLSRQLARREQTTQVRIARELIVPCRSLNRSIAELERELQERTTTIAPRLLALPGCGALSAAKLLCEIGPIDRFRTDAQLARHAGVAPLDASSGKHQRRPPRPWRQPTTQLRAASDRRDAGTRPRPRARLPRAETEGRQKPA
jgi:transposase